MLVKISDLVYKPSDLKIMDKHHYEKLRVSIIRHGQLRNILIDPGNNIIEGRQIYNVMKEIGHEKIDVKIVDKDSMLARLCLDNEFSDFDFVETSKEIAKTFDLSQKRLLYNILPFQNDDIDNYIESVDFDWKQFDSAGNGKNTQSDKNSKNSNNLFGEYFN